MSKKRSHKNTTRLTLTERMKGIRSALEGFGYGNLGRSLAGNPVHFGHPDFYPAAAADLIIRAIQAHVRATLRRKANRA